MIPAPCRHRLHLVHVGFPGTITAIATHLDGALRGRTWLIVSSVPLDEFLARENYQIPVGTPVIRMDLTSDDTYLTRVSPGPYWQHDLPAGHIKHPRERRTRRYHDEPWATLAGWYVAPDVYVALAPSAGVVIDHTPETSPSPRPLT